MAQWVDIKKVRESITIQQILEFYGLDDNLVRKGDQLIGPCPIHQGTNKSQFHVSILKGIFHCFGDCKSNPALRNGGGNLLDLVRVLERIEETDDPEHTRATRKAALLIADRFGIDSQKPKTSARAPQAAHEPSLAKPAGEDAAPAVISTPEPAVNVPLKFTFKFLDHSHAYLKERGFTQDTIEYFGTGYHGGKGIMTGRIVIPISNALGELVAYAGRWPGNEPPKGEGKYKLPQGFHKSLELFNLHRAKQCAREHGLVVVEGFFDVMRLFQYGVCHAVALMGSALSEAQEQLIVDAVGQRGRVTLLLDGDASGQACTEDALERLSRYVYVRAVHLGDQIQPDDLQQVEVQALFG
jgi:DNA primase